MRILRVGLAFPLLLLAAVPGDDTTRAGVKPSASDTLMLYYPNDPNTINPILSSDTVSEDFQRWVIDTLAESKFSNPDEWEPSLAENWEFDEKALEYTIHLRKGVKWNASRFPDGTPIPAKEFTAADVKFTYDVVLNENVDAASYRSYYEDPEAKTKEDKYKVKVSVVDPYTVKIKWSKPYFMADEWSLGLPLLPKHIYSVDAKGEPISNDISGEEFAKGFNDHWANSLLIGTGPMMFSSWKKNERLELIRNPDYWGKPFYFNKVVFRNIPNSNTSLEMTLNGELDWSVIAEKSLYVQTLEKPQVKEGKATTTQFDYPGYRYIGWNMKREIFKEKAVRTALAYAIPVQKIIDKVLYGLGTRLSGPFLPTSSSSDPALQPLPFDPDKARALLDGAGWKDTNNNGIRDKTINGKLFELKFDLMIYADTAMYRTIAEVVQQEFRQIGVDVQISPVKWALMLEKLHKKEFDACMLGWALSWKSDLYQIWHSSQADVMESSNAIGYKNPDLDKLIEELRITMDTTKQKQLYRQMHKLLYDDQPYAFLFVDKRTAVFNSRIENVNYYKIRPCVDEREWKAPAARARR
ncbi:MAG TPA: ABC transporter substrate-binding protein [Planctomycetota bacterium]|nr:ABC transporter substrate-binding protein [Planctomycetota bacterium]